MNFYGKRKRLVSAVLTAGMLLSLPAVSHWHELAYASTAQEIKEQAEEDLKNANESIDKLEGKQEEVESDLSNAGDKLEKLLKKQKELQTKIANTQDQVDQANEDLKTAQKKADDEYDSMKLRIQFMYENSADNSLWSAILDSSGLTEMLNRIEYISDMYKSDRRLLGDYQNTVQKVLALTENLNEKMEGLLELQADYEDQQGEVESLIAKLQDKKDKYAVQLAAAEEQAAEYKATIEKQAKIIQRQEAEAARRAAEEEQRRQAAAEAARQAAEARKAQQEAAQQAAAQRQLASNSNSNSDKSEAVGSGSTGEANTGNADSTAGTDAGNSGPVDKTDPGDGDNSSGEEPVSTDESDSSEDYEGGGGGSSGLGDDVSLTDSSNDPEYSDSGVTGEDIVNYALQFVGNPYKWGGNSLTNGCDCSGFVHLVYEHFGYSLPRYSQSFKTVGKAVSYSNIRAGDIVVYPGHVAICIGNGCIVEAQSTRAGITCNRSVDSHTITAIRRVL